MILLKKIKSSCLNTLNLKQSMIHKIKEINICSSLHLYLKLIKIYSKTNQNIKHQSLIMLNTINNRNAVN